MDNLLDGSSFTVLDGLVAALVLISSLMAFARGFLREFVSLCAFAMAIIFAIVARHYVLPMTKDFFETGTNPWYVEIIVAAAAFIFIYMICAFLGRSFSRFIQFGDHVGFFDRIIGLALGIARGLGVAILGISFAYVFVPVQVEENRDGATIPWLHDSYSYKKLSPSARWVHETLGTFFIDKPTNSEEKPITSSEDEPIET